MTRMTEDALSADRKNGRRGFTLLELIVVIAILAVLAAIVAPNIMGRADDAKATEVKVQVKNLATAIEFFKLDNGFYPSSEQGLKSLIEPPTVGSPAKNYRKAGYLDQKRVPNDPWGNQFIYISPGIEHDYEIISLGADNREGGEGYDADISNWKIE